MVPDVQERAAQPEDDELRAPQRATEQSEPEPDADDADVLDAVVGEQALDVVLTDREGYSQHARSDAEPEHHAAPPHRWRGEERSDPHEPVDAGLDEDTRHHG